MADNPNVQVSASTVRTGRFVAGFTVWQRVERFGSRC